eukprot:SAG22_NODE_787_length_7239_cov_4.418487_7_plen_283_part_00
MPAAPSGAGRPRYGKIELVYFDIHARGEPVRLLFALAGRSGELTDTRLPLFFESAAATKEWEEVHKPRTPLGFVPYLRLSSAPGTAAASVEEEDPQVVPGAAACASFAARYLGLAGETVADSTVADGIAAACLDCLTPALTRLALAGDSPGMLREVSPAGETGRVLGRLELHVRGLKRQRRQLLHGSGGGGGAALQAASECWVPLSAGRSSSEGRGGPSLADIAIFCLVEECACGPRGDSPIGGVEQVLRRECPSLMEIADGLRGCSALRDHLRQRQLHQKL